jgi:hypothetical protein
MEKGRISRHPELINRQVDDHAKALHLADKLRSDMTCA